MKLQKVFWSLMTAKPVKNNSNTCEPRSEASRSQAGTTYLPAKQNKYSSECEHSSEYFLCFTACESYLENRISKIKYPTSVKGRISRKGKRSKNRQRNERHLEEIKKFS